MSTVNTVFDSAQDLRADRLPARSFVAACGCGRPDCPVRRTEVLIMDPAPDIARQAPAVARNVRTYLVEVEDDPHLYMVIGADQINHGEYVQRILVVRMMPDGRPVRTAATIAQDVNAAIVSVFWNYGDEVLIESGPGTATISGPASALDARSPVCTGAPVGINLLGQPGDGYQA